MKILITGGAGFIGSHLCDKYVKNGDTVLCLDNFMNGNLMNIRHLLNYRNFKLVNGDLRDFDLLEKIMRDVDAVFHLAAQIHVDRSIIEPKLTYDVNVLGTQNILEVARMYDVEKIIHASTSEVYGSAQYVPMDEKHPLGPSTPYAASKAAGDIIVLSYYRTFDTDCAIIRPFNNYGPRQNEGTYAGVIPLTIKRILNDEAPVIYGDGEQTRDYIYVTETARMAIEIYKNERTRGKVINIGSGGETSILTVMKEIMKLLNCDKEIKFVPARPADVRRHIANIYLAEDILGFKQEIDFEKGMKMTVDWYLKNMKTGKDD